MSSAAENNIQPGRDIWARDRPEEGRPSVGLIVGRSCPPGRPLTAGSCGNQRQTPGRPLLPLLRPIESLLCLWLTE